MASTAPSGRSGCPLSRKLFMKAMIRAGSFGSTIPNSTRWLRMAKMAAHGIEQHRALAHQEVTRTVHSRPC